MSYRSDKEKMQKEAQAHRRSVLFIIKVTFVAFAAFLLIFCITLVLSSVFEWDVDNGADTKAPSITQNMNVEGFEAYNGGVVGYVGVTPTFKKFISVSDDTDEVPIVSVEHNVDINTVGTYTVRYTVEDASGNVAHKTLTYEVKKDEYSLSTLMALIGEKAAELKITHEMSKVQQVRAIYDYVHTNITFTDESNIPNIDRSKWQSDWLEEAVRGLETMEGDCYTYYSLSKAFFEYFGIESYGIKRAENYEGAEDDGTHFWSAVNVGDGSDRWYYYDATRLNGYFNGNKSDKNACLITEAKLKSHKTSSGETYFYKMTKAYDFPTISTEELD
jgi:hypothetical protein